MTIAIIGADGQLGTDIALAFEREHPAALTEKDIDVADARRVESVLADLRPGVVINTAAFTDVDRCETEEERAFQVNALGAMHIAKSCSALGSVLIHISTDYVFGGMKSEPYLESDAPSPVNAYGRTKLAGELYIRSSCATHYIVRTSGLYGLHPCIGKGGRNFVDTMLKLARERDALRVVQDEVLSPTFTEDLARQIAVFINGTLPFGIYHATNEGECSWFEFAKEIFAQARLGVLVEPTTSAQWNAPARRPAYSALENAGLKARDLYTMPPWRDALRRYLVKRGAVT
ncbi:MAG: dTDP-4-dehydrorhamnose reductase [Chitinivibrionia bacterium]|nr:dTDP-4-dehydrorhamnose reductase [Chitinivibrionia bacterium]